MCKFFLLAIALFAPLAEAQEISPEPRKLAEAEIQEFLKHPPENLNDAEKTIDVKAIACWGSEHEPAQTATVFLHQRKNGGRFPLLCEKWKISEKLSELKALFGEYRRLSGIDTSFCGGTYGGDIFGNIILREWQTAIDTNPLREISPATLDKEWKDNEYKKMEGLQFPNNFEPWAQQGLWEKEEYAKTMELRDKAYAALQRYYIQHFHIKKEQAQRLANYYLNNFAYDYLGRASKSYRSITINDVQTFLEDPIAGQKHYRSDSINMILNIAILNGFSLQDIKRILPFYQPKAEVPSTDYFVHLTPEGYLYKNEDNIIDYGRNEIPLMKAVARPNVLEFLLNTGKWDVNAQNWFGKTALMYAAQYNNLESVKLLLAHGANPNLTTFEDEEDDSDCAKRAIRTKKRTPLMYAAWHGTPEMVKTFLDAGANASAHDAPMDHEVTPKTARDYLGDNTLISDKKRKEMCLLLTP